MVKERDQAFKEKNDLQKSLDTQNGAITQITTERDNLRKQIAGLIAAAKSNEATLNSLQQQIDELLKELTKIAAADPETHQKYKSAVSEFIERIIERL